MSQERVQKQPSKKEVEEVSAEERAAEQKGIDETVQRGDEVIEGSEQLLEEIDLALLYDVVEVVEV